MIALDKRCAAYRQKSRCINENYCKPKIKPLSELKQLQASTSKTLLKPVNKPALKPINKFVNLNYDYAPELAISPSNSNKSPTDIKVIEIIDDDEKILDTSVKKISVQCEFCSQQFSKYQDLHWPYP